MTTPAQKKRVLLIDDDAGFTSILGEFLVTRSAHAWDVEVAGHYTAALASVKKTNFDLAVLDFHMPVMDGLQLLTLLRRTHPNLPVVVLTGYATEENRAFALKHGAALFLDKASVEGGFDSIFVALETIVSTAAPPVEGFRGMLRQVGLPDVLQMECLGRKSSILEIQAGNAGGRIFICDGSIQHAEAGSVHGEPALFKLLGLKGGEFHLKPFTTPPKQTIDGHWESLLMEAARLRDEADGAAAGIDADATSLPTQTDEALSGPALEEAVAVESQVIEFPTAEPQPPMLEASEAEASGVEWRTQEILICSSTGDVLYEWQAAGIDRRMRLLNHLASQAEWLEQSLPLGRAGRLEIAGLTERTVAVLEPDHRVFVRTAPAMEGTV